MMLCSSQFGWTYNIMCQQQRYLYRSQVNVFLPSNSNSNSNSNNKDKRREKRNGGKTSYTHTNQQNTIVVEPVISLVSYLTTTFHSIFILFLMYCISFIVCYSILFIIASPALVTSYTILLTVCRNTTTSVQCSQTRLNQTSRQPRLGGQTRLGQARLGQVSSR